MICISGVLLFVLPSFLGIWVSFRQLTMPDFWANNFEPVRPTWSPDAILVQNNSRTSFMSSTLLSLPPFINMDYQRP